ncbi:hypothetical protein [Calidifontibacillus oryziterrae]|uniref:hypothetical protein n=1 Tax=Calidifontibacillus oryziterrae TaxID=1191699 RepID=UPI0002DDF8C8|nr:hypothetical protein [Calidifontibacillus oryziterrae]
MNNVLRWIIFLVIGVVLGFMVSLLFNNTDQVATTEQQPQAVEETVPGQSSSSEIASEETENPSGNEDNILVQKGCIQCHDVSPLGIKGNGTGPDLAIAYDDVKNRFGKSLEEFLAEPEGTMSAVFSQTPLNDDEKQAVLSLIKDYGEK